MAKFYDMNGYKVYMKVADYLSDPMVLAVIATAEDDEFEVTLSVNIGNSIGNNSLMPPNCAFIDTNNNPGAEEFLQSIGAKPYERFGSPVFGYSGFCRYPLYEFPENLLREMDAAGYEEHLKKYGDAFRKEQRRMNIEMFGFDPFDDGE
ncbi:MAG TPA: DUF4313 domain-containing protein [Ruminococcus sp.]|nr:DUF4313 domain-containing protein [Ruminococcus sp.]